jgi:CheY-like chemotaxis protein
VGIYAAAKKMGVKYNLTKPVKSQELLQYLRNIQIKPVARLTGNTHDAIAHSGTSCNSNSPVVLVAEDVVLNMLLVTTILKQLVPNVVILKALNGKEARDMAIANNPDLILMDIQMPEMSGIEATVAIRNFEKGKDRKIPIVALTAGAIKGEKERCFEAGMNDFLTKPIDRTILSTVLGTYLSSVQV